MLRILNIDKNIDRLNAPLYVQVTEKFHIA